MWYLLNDRDELSLKSITQQEGYYFHNEDYDLELYTVTVGHINADGSLIISKKVLKSSVELVFVMKDQSKKIELLKQQNIQLENAIAELAYGGVV